jgi:hypothetical protein
MKRINLQGRQFGEWTVLRWEYKNPRGFWICKCSCGVIKKITAQNLLSGASTKCRKCAFSLPEGEAAFNDLFGRYRRGANKRGYEWELSRGQARQLFQGKCVYCGGNPSSVWGSQLNSPVTYNGIDRVDSSRGYTQSNCVSCCKICNYMKQQLPRESFVAHVRKIHAHLESL